MTAPEEPHAVDPLVRTIALDNAMLVAEIRQEHDLGDNVAFAIVAHAYTLAKDDSLRALEALTVQLHDLMETYATPAPEPAPPERTHA